MYDIWEAAGGHAKTDVLKQAPPMFLSGWIARRLHPLPPMARGAVAMATTMMAPCARPDRAQAATATATVR